jgi:Na+/H+-dicarboxylate symporter
MAIVLGVLIGYFYPNLGKELKPLGDGFIALIKMMIAPIIFCTVVHGISSMGDLKRVGRVGLKALIYFDRSEIRRLLRHQGKGGGDHLTSACQHSHLRRPFPSCPIYRSSRIAILVGIDKFMSECRALTNLIGNGVACVVISLSEGELDKDKLHETMAHPIQLGEALEPGAS